MRRTYNTNVPDSRATNCLEVTRRLYRGITDIAKRLDDQKGCALTITDLFTPSGEVSRGKLKDYCERLIFKDPVGHARKTEELLWRKGFYDTVSAAKKLRKGNVWNETEKALLSTHLAVGVGFYHHLILRLQLEYSLDLSGVIDFAYPKEKTILSNPKPKSPQNKLLSDEIRQCAVRIIHRSLICLGDLARYKIDLDPNWDPIIATRYYKIAVSIDPNIGMPHNQLGTMAGNKNYGLDAVYHYMRCILCTETFEGTEGNLKRIINAHSYSGNEKISFQRCVAKLFSLLQLWNNDTPDSEHINHDCQDLLVELESCFVAKKAETCVSTENNIENEDDIDIYLKNCKNEQLPCLTDEMIFKIVAICLMSIVKLKSKESNEVQGAIAFTLTILSQLMQITINRLQEAVTKISSLNGIDEGFDVDKQNLDIDNEKEIDVLNDCGNGIAKQSSRDVNEEKGSEENVEKPNGMVGRRIEKKNREKSKSLLTKLRRPRKRLNSSDSEASDVDGVRAETSSDEMNSDISETEEEDARSECNEISDDALTDDLSEDETAKNASYPKSRLNGHDPVIDEKVKTSEEYENHLTKENGEEMKIDDSIDSKSIDKDIIGNSLTTTTNSGACDENGSSSNALAHAALLKKQNLSPIDILEILEHEGSLQAIKICFDWLRGNPEIFKMFGRSSSASLQRVVSLLNLITIDSEALLRKWNRDSILSSSTDKLKESTEIIPLPEDIDMRGLKLFDEAHKKLDWSVLRQTKMYKYEETLFRALKLTNFGYHLCTIPESGVKFDENKNIFVTIDVKNSETVDNEEKICVRDAETEQSKGKLMRHMGRLWLKAEVRALESRLKSRLMSPYLVPDQEALAKHTPALKRLVYAKKFVIIIPSVVVSALDEMKRTSSKAREATRWLEGQLRKGSRFLRAQRPNERLPLPLIKGPKTKDKEAWLFFQIIECCHYLTQQTKVGLNGDKEPPVVTLLTGLSIEERKMSSYSTDGLAKTAGVNLEHIEAFHTKWKTSSKSHG